MDILDANTLAETQSSTKQQDALERYQDDVQGVVASMQKRNDRLGCYLALMLSDYIREEYQGLPPLGRQQPCANEA